jgi:uncharacterized LabA/DUF88 family protein
MRTKRVCIFIDGENFRNSIVELFPNFNKYDYLPKNADWSKFFDFITKEVSKDDSERVRTYWYVVQNIDFHPRPNTQELEKARDNMQNRFNGWVNIQDSICGKHESIEFRRAGSIKYDLEKKILGSEKAVDVKLAVDLIHLKEIYDIAVIVSGDQDYVPAVCLIKDFGKHTVNVSFLKEDGTLLPTGARRLNQTVDKTLQLKYSDFKKYLNL